MLTNPLEESIKGFSKEARELKMNVFKMKHLQKKILQCKKIVNEGVKTHEDIGFIRASATNVAEMGHNAILFFTEFREKSHQRINARLCRKFNKAKQSLDELSREAQKLSDEINHQVEEYRRVSGVSEQSATAEA